MGTMKRRFYADEKEGKSSWATQFVAGSPVRKGSMETAGEIRSRRCLTRKAFGFSEFKGVSR